MSFIFRDWNAFVLKCLEVLRHNQNSDIESKRQEWIKKSVEYKESVENRVIEYMLSKAKNKEKKQYIKLLEIMSVNLLDKVYSSCQPNTANNSMIELLLDHLKNFLFFLEENFCDYFDYRHTMPIVIFKFRSGELSGLTESICKACTATSTRISYIVEFIAQSFKKFCNKSIAPTFSQMNFHLELAKELLQPGIITSEEKLKSTLFYFNYNHKSLCELLGKQLMQTVRKQKVKSSQMVMLLLEQKKIGQNTIKSHYCLQAHLPSLKDQLNEWISAEMNFLKLEGLTPEVGKNSYVHVPFRGTEIYLLHKAFVDSGGAVGETYKSLFEKTASHLINNNQRGFSIESLQKNSDKINYEAKDNIRRFLQKMIRNIESY